MKRHPRIHTRYPRPDAAVDDRRLARLNRFHDARTAEDDYFRFANRPT